MDATTVERSTAEGAHQRGRLFASALLPMAPVSASALLALMIGVALPLPALEGILKKGGLVENATASPTRSPCLQSGW